MHKCLLRFALEAAPERGHIRAAELSDVAALTRFYHQMSQEREVGWGEWGERDTGALKYALKTPDVLALLVLEGSKVVGYLHAVRHNFNPQRDFYFIEKIGVLKSYRHHGWGRKLLARAIRQARHLRLKTLELIVEKSNHKAIDWYEKHGFKADGEKYGGLAYVHTLRKRK